MAVAAVLSVSCAARTAMGAAKLGHPLARNRTMPAVGPAVGTAAGVVFSHRERPGMREGETDEEARAMAYGLDRLVAEIPAETPPKAVDDARDAVTRLPAQRRARVAGIQGGPPSTRPCAARPS